MDWDSANVGLDQEAFKAAQAAGDTGFSVPWWIILIIVVVGAVMAFTVVKKSKDGGASEGATGESSGSDK